MQRFSIRVAEFELDMPAVALDGFAADPKFFRDLTGAMASRNEREHRHLAIAKDIEGVWKIATAGKLSHCERSDRSTGVDLTGEHSLNRAHQLVHRAVLHPVTSSSRTKGALGISPFGLPGYDKDVNTRKFRGEILDPADGIAVLEKRFDEQHIGAMLANEFIRVVKSMCGAANTVPRVAANNRDQTLLADDGIADSYDPDWFKVRPSCDAFLHGSELSNKPPRQCNRNLRFLRKYPLAIARRTLADLLLRRSWNDVHENFPISRAAVSWLRPLTSAAPVFATQRARGQRPRLQPRLGEMPKCAKMRSPWRPPLQLQQLGKLPRIRHGCFASEILAHISGWFSIDRRHRANRLVFYAEIHLTFSAIREK